METSERLFSGYCRQLDQSRMVLCEYAQGVFTQGDCAYPDCPFDAGCPIAAAIRAAEAALYDVYSPSAMG